MEEDEIQPLANPRNPDDDSQWPRTINSYVDDPIPFAHLYMQLLEPLFSEPGLLAACLEHAETVQDRSGDILPDAKLLDIHPLINCWLERLAEFNMESVTGMTLDLSMPKQNDDREPSEKLRWDTVCDPSQLVVGRGHGLSMASSLYTYARLKKAGGLECYTKNRPPDSDDEESSPVSVSPKPGSEVGEAGSVSGSHSDKNGKEESK